MYALRPLFRGFVFLVGSLLSLQGATPARILLIAGKPSHPPGQHEFRAGSLILQRCFNEQKGVELNVASNGWPSDDTALDNFAAVIIYADGGGGHPAIQADHSAQLDALARKGIGLGFMHFGVEVPNGDPGASMQRWIGGYYEHEFSCNPMWSPEFKDFPDHPVTRGVQPFSVRDEWYFNMRFREDMKGITPILVAAPPDQVRDGPYVWPRGPYPHIQAAKGRPETMMWVREREDGGRGFGFTGGHFHSNWGNPDFRKIVLNAFLWIARVEVPATGVDSSVPETELRQNLDSKKQ